MSGESRAIDMAIVGGGLHGCLVALALARWRPEARVVMIEAQDRFGGGAVAPFRLEGVSPAMARVIDPLIVAEWPRYYVETGDAAVSVSDRLAMIDPAQLHAELCAHLRPADCWRNTPAEPRGDRSVMTSRGAVEAGLVLDLRPPSYGAGPAILATTIAYRSPEPLALEVPILFDRDLAGRTGAAVWQHFPIGRHGVTARALRFDTAPLRLPARFVATHARAPRETAIPLAADPRWPCLPPHPVLPTATESALALAQAMVELREWTPRAYAAARADAATAIAPAAAARSALLATLFAGPAGRAGRLADLAGGMAG